MFHEIQKCRICGNSNLTLVLDLGSQVLTGMFPKSRDENIEAMPLKLVKCIEDSTDNTACGLLQLQHTGDLSQFYGENYGYRSGLNRSMVVHLQNKVKTILSLAKPAAGDLVIDIGSNDSTTLQAYPTNLQLVGVDPTGIKFKKYYPSHIDLIPDFFSAQNVQRFLGTKKAKIITSFSMFYDLEDPLAFMSQIHEVLDQDGVWVFEQSYMPTMLEQLSYDTVCHEHLEYYGLRQIEWMTKKVGFEILDVELNDVNGGSFSVTVAKVGSGFKANHDKIQSLLKKELALGLHTLAPYQDFEQKTLEHRKKLKNFVTHINATGKRIFAYGASTKGNVTLQYCGLTEKDIPFVAEVNEDKFGSFTPGSLIPIISESQAKSLKPDYFLVLPWHFKDSIIAREKDYVTQGGQFIFPLPGLNSF